MSLRGSSLQDDSAELVKCIGELKKKRQEIDEQILDDEAQHARVQRDLILTLRQIQESVSRKKVARSELSKIIEETEEAYLKLLESSHELLEVIRRESKTICSKEKSYSYAAEQGMAKTKEG